MVPIGRLAQWGGLGLCLSLAAGAARAESPMQFDPPFQSLRYNEDFSWLARKSDPTPWERLKYIPLGASDFGPIFLTLGGEIRERHENYVNINYGIKTPAASSYQLQRLLLDGDLHVTDYFRAFVQLGDQRIFGERGAPSTTDVDRFDLMQHFADLRLPSPFGDAPTFRYGREELLYGYQRLIAVREGPNVRRDFDGFRFIDKIGEASVDILAVQPTVDSPYAMNDSTNAAQHLGGLYVTTPLAGPLRSDLYALDYSNTQARFRGLTGVERIETYGVRLFGAANGFDWNFEASDQIGTFRTQPVQAYLLAGVFGYTPENVDIKPRFGFSINQASGDNAHSRTIGTFNAMFPRLPYFAETPVLVPANVRDIRPVFSFTPADRVNVILGLDLLWRVSTTDGLYGSGMTQIPNTNKVSGLRVGSEFSIDARWQADQFWQLGAILAQFYAGPALTEAGGKNMTYAVLFVKFLF
ncbi:alginate export family protein [uncultured Rhodoblastus sp.]|uniref:alginate export family protein n=1 Tax=uncultured Rhodoblastus sp. TaxID=543037 RepID=UPI0025DE98D7|nr:alginate export family protein [uncultured Rhodoblastus sp.]